jgi:anti-sigma factor RsiW
MSGEDRRRFDAHLGECPFCTSYLEQMRATVARLGALPGDPLPADVRADALAAFRDWRSA